ncbi:MAG TPA: RtcB family protein [Candidatus Babeliales bacterium]|nr:RtcB family protein [Candidatus Babeliales bacterium]
MAERPVTKYDLVQVDEYTWDIPQSFRSDMRVPARVFTHESMLDDILDDRSLLQLTHVATLPGIQKYAYAMPDIHQGYGFPIGGVAGMAIDQGGVISPGGIGYDINCGVRLLVANKSYEELKPYMEKLATALFDAVPSGVGRGGNLELSKKDLDNVLMHGAEYMVQQGFGTNRDLAFCEEKGRMRGADPDMVSEFAKNRGADQLGTLGSGNHFLEVQRVDQIYDQKTAQAFGLSEGSVTVMIHCGSRGLGHQICTDYVRLMMKEVKNFGITLPDRELVCAPFESAIARNYFAAMVAGSNFAWANRHLIAHSVRKAFKSVVGRDTDLDLLYDVSHNIGKVEDHIIDGAKTQLIMHRKGATRAFGPGFIELPSDYRDVGQPVLIPGTMGTASYVLVGTDTGMNVSLGSSCHGAGRRMSRMEAKNNVAGSNLRREMEALGIIIKCESNAGLAEEAPIAYKDVDNVVAVVDGAGIAKKVARMVPLAVIKGG